MKPHVWIGKENNFKSSIKDLEGVQQGSKLSGPYVSESEGTEVM